MTCEYLIVMHSVFKVHILLGALNPIRKKVPVYHKIVPTPSLLILMLWKKKDILSYDSFSLHFYFLVVFATSSACRQFIFLHCAGNSH